MKRFLSSQSRYRASSVFALSLAFLLCASATAYGAITLSGTGFDSSTNDIDISGNRLLIDDPGPTFTGTASQQTVQADAEFDTYVGHSGGYGGGVMGHVFGDVTGSTAFLTGGLIGKYNVSANASAGPQGAVIGEIGEEAADNDANSFIAVLGGDDPDSGTLTPNAAYGVQYLNLNAASKFTYGVDLSHAAAGFTAVSYGTADIRLAGAGTVTPLIKSGSGAPSAGVCNANTIGSIYLRTDGGTISTTVYVCVTAGGWTALTIN